MTGDYGGYKAIVEEAKELERADRANPSPACPVCGTILDVNGRGQRNCPMAHYRDIGRATPAGR